MCFVYQHNITGELRIYDGSEIPVLFRYQLQKYFQSLLLSFRYFFSYFNLLPLFFYLTLISYSSLLSLFIVYLYIFLLCLSLFSSPCSSPLHLFVFPSFFIHFIPVYILFYILSSSLYILIFFSFIFALSLRYSFLMLFSFSLDYDHSYLRFSCTLEQRVVTLL